MEFGFEPASVMGFGFNSLCILEGLYDQ